MTAPISIIIPFYKKFREFSITLPLNEPYFSKSEREVVICLDSPDQEQEVLDLIKRYNTIKWKILINRYRKEVNWRNPCKALNVGIRNASYDWVSILSPETYLKNDIFEELLKAAAFKTWAFGNVVFQEMDVKDKVVAESLPMPYGSIIYPKQILFEVHGYCERFNGHGGDDNNIRIRLEKANYQGVWSLDTTVYHLEFGKRPDKYTTNDLSLIYNPPSIYGNSDDNWGKDYSEVIYQN